MSGEDVELGPIDYLVVEWPAGKQPSGEGLPRVTEEDEANAEAVTRWRDGEDDDEA